MKKLLFIFALLIASCDTTDILPVKSVAIQISDANPVQFWLIDCDTYNEKEVCGIHQKCWCQPWQCDDEIKVQFTDDSFDSEYNLLVYDEDDVLIDTIPFVRQNLFFTPLSYSFSNDDFTSSLTSWNQDLAATSFNWEAPGVAFADGSGPGFAQTSRILQARETLGLDGYNKFPAGTYVFNIRVQNTSTGGSAPLQESLYVNAFDDLNGFGEAPVAANTVTRLGSYEIQTLTITTTQPWNYFGFGLSKQGPSSGSEINARFDYIRIMDVDALDFTKSVYDASFVPSSNSPDLCNKRIRLVIVDVTDADVEVAKSDCLDIREEHKCTTLIEYSNNRNFAGLIYQDVSPEQTFQIRVPAIFFHNQFPEEDEAIELTTGITKTSGTLKVQRLFDTDYMPYYMHQKLMLIFKHQTINIDALSWVKEEKYEIQEGNRMWPVKKAKVFLTENYIQRAVL